MTYRFASFGPEKLTKGKADRLNRVVVRIEEVELERLGGQFNGRFFCHLESNVTILHRNVSFLYDGPRPIVHDLLDLVFAGLVRLFALRRDGFDHGDLIIRNGRLPVNL